MDSIALTYPLTRDSSRLSRGAGFWAIALAFLVLGAFATAPSALYGLRLRGGGAHPYDGDGAGRRHFLGGEPGERALRDESFNR